MRFLILIILACQVLCCCSKTSDSALSCVLRKSNDVSICVSHLDLFQKIIRYLRKILLQYVGLYNELRINRSYNVTDNHSLESMIDFRLYTQQYPNGKEIIFRDAKSLKYSGFNENFPTHIITHGFNARGVDNACMGPMKGTVHFE